MEQEKECRMPGCGRVASYQGDFCAEHLFSPRISAREAECRKELQSIAEEARRKQASGLDLNNREREVLLSFDVINQRFGGHYPAPTQRHGRVCLDSQGNVVTDPLSISGHLRVRPKNSEKMQRIFLTGVIEEV